MIVLGAIYVWKTTLIRNDRFFMFEKVSRNLPCIIQGRSVYDSVRILICSIMVTVLPGHRRQATQGVAQIRIQN